jgi:hypothetical protein
MEEVIVPEISLKDESLDINNSADYNLSIQVSQKEFTYCVLDTVRNKFLAFESFKLHDTYNPYQLSERLDELVLREKWLSGNYKTKKIIYINQKSTLVPVPLFDANDQETYFSFNHTLDDSEDLYCDKLNNLNAYNLYAVPTVIKNKLRELFGQHKLYHHITALVETLLIYYKNKPEEKLVFLNAGKGIFDLIVTEGNKLIYNNTFEFQTPEDLIYYLLFALEQLKLNPETISLILMGEIEKNTALFDIIFKYVRNISFIKRNESFQYSYLLDKLSPHSYFSLFNSNLFE